MTAPAIPARPRAGSAAASFAARLPSGWPPALRASRCATRPTPRPPQPPPSPPRPPRPQASRPAQGRPRRAVGSLAGRAKAGPPAAPKAPAPAAKAAPGPVTRPGGQVYRPRVLAGMADVEALRTLRAEGVPSLLSGAARHGQEEPARGGLPRPDHGGRGRRHHGGGLRRRVHPEARRHVRGHLPAADQGDAGRPGAFHRRRSAPRGAI